MWSQHLKNVGLVPPDAAAIPQSLFDDATDLSRIPINSRQRLAFVRALLRRPGVLVLDEMAEALLPEEHDRVEAILAAHINMTVIQVCVCVCVCVCV